MCLILAALTTDAPPHKQQLHRHPGDPAVSPPPKSVTKSSYGYNKGGLILWLPRTHSLTTTLS